MSAELLKKITEVIVTSRGIAEGCQYSKVMHFIERKQKIDKTSFMMPSAGLITLPDFLKCIVFAAM